MWSGNGSKRDGHWHKSSEHAAATSSRPSLNHDPPALWLSRPERDRNRSGRESPVDKAKMRDVRGTGKAAGVQGWGVFLGAGAAGGPCPFFIAAETDESDCFSLFALCSPCWPCFFMASENPG